MLERFAKNSESPFLKEEVNVVRTVLDEFKYLKKRNRKKSSGEFFSVCVNLVGYMEFSLYFHRNEDKTLLEADSYQK